MGKPRRAARSKDAAVSEAILVRCTAEEMAAIRVAAESDGISLSRYIATAAHDAAVSKAVLVRCTEEEIAAILAAAATEGITFSRYVARAAHDAALLAAGTPRPGTKTVFTVHAPGPHWQTIAAGARATELSVPDFSGRAAYLIAKKIMAEADDLVTVNLGEHHPEIENGQFDVAVGVTDRGVPILARLRAEEMTRLGVGEVIIESDPESNLAWPRLRVGWVKESGDVQWVLGPIHTSSRTFVRIRVAIRRLLWQRGLPDMFRPNRIYKPRWAHEGARPSRRVPDLPP